MRKENTEYHFVADSANRVRGHSQKVVGQSFRSIEPERELECSRRLRSSDPFAHLEHLAAAFALCGAASAGTEGCLTGSTRERQGHLEAVDAGCLSIRLPQGGCSRHDPFSLQRTLIIAMTEVLKI